MHELECRGCGYKFKSQQMAKRCPYCNKEGKVGYAKTAQDMLDETFAETSVMDEDRRRRG